MSSKGQFSLFMKIANVVIGQNKKLVSTNVAIN